MHRLHKQYWQSLEDEEWRLYMSASNRSGRPYTKHAPAKGIVTAENNYNSRYEFKLQRFPLTQEWEDCD